MAAGTGNPRNLWRRYVVAIALIVALVAGDHFFATGALDTGDELATAINVSGKQCMLSQRILYFRSHVVDGKGDAATHAGQHLTQTIDAFERAHGALISGGDLGLSGDLGPELKNHYFNNLYGPSLDAMTTRFISDARHLLSEDHLRAGIAWQRMRRDGAGTLLQGLDKAVKLFETQARSTVSINKTLATVSFALALLVLLAEALFIFWPAHRSILHALDGLESRNRDLERSQVESQDLLLAAETAYAEIAEIWGDAEDQSRRRADALQSQQSALMARVEHLLGSLALLRGTGLEREVAERLHDLQQGLTELGDDIAQLSTEDEGDLGLTSLEDEELAAAVA